MSEEPVRPVLSVAPSDALWQRRLLPFMIGSLIFVAVAFLVSTFWFFSDLQEKLKFAPTNVVAPFAPTGAADVQNATYRDWYVRAALEQSALRQRFDLQTTVVRARLWTRVMGFMTGMLLALTGCVFVLGKLREQVNFSATKEGIGLALATSSPGVFLALLGAIIISVALTAQFSIEASDTAVYLPRQVQLEGANGPRPDPPNIQSLIGDVPKEPSAKDVMKSLAKAEPAAAAVPTAGK